MAASLLHQFLQPNRRLLFLHIQQLIDRKPQHLLPSSPQQGGCIHLVQPTQQKACQPLLHDRLILDQP